MRMLSGFLFRFQEWIYQSSNMKKLFYLAAALCAAIGFASCEKALQDLNPEFSQETVTIASSESAKVSFTLNDVRGNEITAKYTCTAVETYDIKVDFESDYSAGTITITAPSLILEGDAFDVNVTLEDAANERVAAKTIKVNPTVVSGLVKFTDAANSFVVAPGSVVVFPTCKGNSAEKVQPAKLNVVWQDAQSLFVDTPKIMDGEAIVRFKDGVEGNVVLAAVDASDKVLWSWLFWVVSDTPKDVTVGDFTFMDRNIGALNLDEKSELSVGVTYQYGRKDPFPSIKFGEYALRTIYDASGAEVTIPIVKTEEADNLENTIQNPATFYNNVYVSGAKHGYSWITNDCTVYGAEKFAALWQNDGKKSMYDPCPAGYKIADKAAWDGVKTASASDVKELWDNSYETFDATAIGTNEKYAAGNRKKVQFRGCVYSGLRLTITGEINSNSAQFSYANCIGKPLPTAEVWCAEIDPDFPAKINASYFRGCAVKVNTTGNGNYDDVSAVKVNPLATTGKYTLNYALPVRCIKEK